VEQIHSYVVLIRATSKAVFVFADAGAA